MAWQAHCRGNLGVGAVLTGPAGVIVAAGRNRVRDVEAPRGRLHTTYLAHAEMDVLAQLPHGDYPDHTLWTTLEPCLMCASAVVLSHVGIVRYAAADPLGRASSGSRI
jgi:tRNA(Arg) A34 adenosine deaminase TadA